MDWILLVFIISIFAFTRVSLRQWNAAYLSPANANALRGIMSIAIILHHLAEHCSSGRVFPYLQQIGYLLVAVFFFLSGYGLMIQLSKKGTAYLQSLWTKRILFFVIIFVLDTLLYLVFRILNGNSYTFRKVCMSFVNGHTIAGNAWYLVALIHFYVFFYVAFKVFRKPGRAVVSLFLMIIGCGIVWKLIGYKSIWLYSDLAFCCGVLWSIHREAIESFCKSHYWCALGLITACFAVFSGIPLGVKGDCVYVLCRMISAPLFAVLIIVLLQKITFTGWFWQKISIIALEIFLLHALVYRLLRSNMIRVENDVLWAVLTLVITVIISIPAHQLNMKIKDWVSRL